VGSRGPVESNSSRKLPVDVQRLADPGVEWGAGHGRDAHGLGGDGVAMDQAGMSKGL
jgi:hypothetical protein